MTIARGWINYTTDFGETVTIKAGVYTAASNSQTLSVFPTQSTTWPYHAKDLRHVTGVQSSTGKRAKMVVTDLATYNALTIGTSSFTISSGAFAIVSKIGEKLNARDLR